MRSAGQGQKGRDGLAALTGSCQVQTEHKVRIEVAESANPEEKITLPLTL